MWKFDVRSGATRGSKSTEERHVNVKKDIVVRIINDLLCYVVRANTSTKVRTIDKDRAKIQQQLGEDVQYA